MYGTLCGSATLSHSSVSTPPGRERESARETVRERGGERESARETVRERGGERGGEKWRENRKCKAVKPSECFVYVPHASNSVAVFARGIIISSYLFCCVTKGSLINWHWH